MAVHQIHELLKAEFSCDAVLRSMRWRDFGGDRGGFIFPEDNEAGLDCGDLEGQLGRVRGPEQGGQFGGFLDARDAGVDDALVRGVVS